MATESRGLIGDIAAAWGDLRGSIRAQFAINPPESRLLALLYVACLMGFVTGLPSAWKQAQAVEVENAVAAVITARLFSAIFFAPLFLYGVAALSRLGARVLGGRGSHYRARVALIWALCVGLPLLIASGLATAFLAPFPALSAAVQIAAGLGFVWIWSVFIAEAEYFRSAGVVFAVVAGIVTAILAILLLA